MAFQLCALAVLLICGPILCYGQDNPCAVNKFNKTCISPELEATYAEILDLPNHPEKLLIDVRTPEEISCTGLIPISINIPLSIVAQELQLSADQFLCKYGRKKPCFSDPIIFTCRSGNRAAEAAYVASMLGYTNVKNYVGSWLEYGAKHNLPLSC